MLINDLDESDVQPFKEAFLTLISSSSYTSRKIFR